MAKTSTKSDKRLTGTWQSDRRKTFQNYRPDKSISAAHLRRFKALFGKFTVRWGRTKYYTELDGFRDSGNYEIVASDETSVVIRHTDFITGQSELKQIHFEGDYYWFPLGGNLTEWF
jgi:hypothetical protein